tara:strand:- start:457 stop:675 length:219 start_codon:yes stop_codon:yes gene_type:complete
MSDNDQITLKQYFSERMDRFEKALEDHRKETREAMSELERKVDLWTWRGISASFGALAALVLAGWNAFVTHK